MESRDQVAALGDEHSVLVVDAISLQVWEVREKQVGVDHNSIT